MSDRIKQTPGKHQSIKQNTVTHTHTIAAMEVSMRPVENTIEREYYNILTCTYSLYTSAEKVSKNKTGTAEAPAHALTHLPAQ